METVEQIKKQLAELTAKVNELGKTDIDNVYSFTQEEMVHFVTQLHEGFVDSLKSNANHLDFEDAIELDLCGREIEVNVDNRQICDVFVDECCPDLDEDAVMATVSEIYRNIKG